MAIRFIEDWRRQDAQIKWRLIDAALDRGAITPERAEALRKPLRKIDPFISTNARLNAPGGLADACTKAMEDTHITTRRT